VKEGGAVAEGMTVAELALDLGFLQPDDVVATVVEHLGLDVHDDVLPPAVCVEVRDILNPNGERTAPAPLYWPGHPVSWAGTSPTAGEDLYDDW
jgi:hypothetical protein